MAKDPAARFATPAEVAAALAPFAAGCDLTGLLAAAVVPRPVSAESEQSATGTAPYASSAFTGTDPNKPAPQAIVKSPDKATVTGARPRIPLASSPPWWRRRSSRIAAAAAIPLSFLLGIVIYIEVKAKIEISDHKDTARAETGASAGAKKPLEPFTEQPGAAQGALESRTATHRAPSTSTRRTIPSPPLPQPGWTHHRGDSEGSGFYPYGSTIRTQGAFKPVWSLTTPIRDGFNCVLTGDVKGDGKLEVVVASGRVVKLYDRLGHPIRTISPPLTSGYVDLGVLVPFDEGRAADIGIGTEITSELKGWFYKADGTLLQTFATQGGGAPHDCYMSPVALTRAAAITSLGAGYARFPRGCAAYGKETGSLEWHYRVGPAWRVESVTTIGGQLRVTGYCESVNNGASGDGWNHNGTPTTDASIYTIVVNEDGSEVFTRDYGSGGNTHSHFVDLDRSGVKRLLTFESHDATYYHGRCKINLLDANTGAILKSFYGPLRRPWLGYVWGDFKHNGHAVVVATNGAAAYLLDENLTPLISEPDVRGKVLAAADINGDGKVELLFGDGATLRVTDAEFNELWTWTAPAEIIGVQISDLNGDGVDEVIVETHDGLTVLGAAQARPAAPRTGVLGTVDTSLHVALKANGGSASADSVGR